MRFSDNIQKLSRRCRLLAYHLAAHRRIKSSHIDIQVIHHFFSRIARELGLDAQPLGRVLCISGNGRVFRVFGTATDFDTFPLGSICGDKELTRAIFERHQLAVPEGQSFRADEAGRALQYALALSRPCVIKPARDTSSGKGVSVHLSSAAQIRKAFRLASLFSNKVIVEEFIPGENYRFLVYKGRCLSILHRQRPHVTGNGRDTVRALVLRENAGRVRSLQWHPGDPVLMPLLSGPDALETLRKQGLHWRSVPPVACEVFVAEVCNYAFGASYREVTDVTHPALIRTAEKAASLLGVTLAGVDVITPDIATPVCYINEINTTPGLDIHYHVSNPEQCKDPIRTILCDVFGCAPCHRLSSLAAVNRPV